MLPKNSVGAKQIKKGAVTPAKLSAASKSALTGPPGARGLPGPAGPQGERGEGGEPGPAGPGAISFESPVPENGFQNVIRSYEGINLIAKCSAGSIEFGPATAGGTPTMDINGPVLFLGNSGTEVTADQTAVKSLVLSASGTKPRIDFDVIARNTAAGTVFTHYFLHEESQPCRVWGVITPSIAG